MWPPASFFDNFMRGMLEVNRTVDVAELALAFFMVMFGAAVGISRKNLTFGIAVGFGFFATVRLCVIVLFPHRTLVSGMTLRRVGSAAYVISTLIWLAYVTLETNDTDLRGLS